MDLCWPHVWQENWFVYIRRDGSQSQRSVYLDYRTHINSGIHRVQDHVISNIGRKTSISELAQIAHMSARTLTRTFRAATGVSIAEFKQKVRLEAARIMLNDPDTNIQAVAEQSGFHNPRHLRRAWRREFGTTPSTTKAQSGARNSNL